MTFSDFASAALNEKAWLIHEIEHSASWHEFRAKKYFDKLRDSDCAQALYELSAAIKALPFTHPLFQKLAEINYLYSRENDVVGLGSWLNKTQDLIKQICSSSYNTPKDLINHLVELTDANLAGTRER